MGNPHNSPLVQKDRAYWDTYKKPPFPGKRISGDKLRRYRCNVEGCVATRKRTWANIDRHLRKHGRPAQRQGPLKGERWVCPYCRDCQCCNGAELGGQNKGYTCAKGMRSRHWWCQKNAKRCKHAPTRWPDSSGNECDSISEDEEIRYQSGDVDNTPVSSPSTRTSRTNPEPLMISGINDTSDYADVDVETERDLYWKCLIDAKGWVTVPHWQLTSTHEDNTSIVSLRASYENCQLKKPLVWREYLRAMDEISPMEKPDYWLFLTAPQARIYLESGRPRVPIIVPARLDPKARPLIPLGLSLARLDIYDEVTVHNFDNPDTGGIAHEQMAARAASDQLRQGHGLIMVSDRTSLVANPVPSFLIELAGWDLLPYMRESLQVTKPLSEEDHDLSSNATSLQWAQRGAFSLPRVTRGGVVACVRVEAGASLRLCWPSQTKEELMQFDHGGFPASQPTAVLLRPGDTLVQPSGTPYSDYFGSEDRTTLLCETISAPSQDLHRQLECVYVETWSHMSITGYDERYKVENKLARCIELATAKNAAFPWMTDGELVKLRVLFQEWWDMQNGLRRGGCTCKKICTKSCKCRKMQIPCSSACHDDNIAREGCKPPLLSDLGQAMLR